ncbi:pentatricopeptide repeat-containing protein At2g03380, mitochondrial-like [Pistacia vera]|uniref:pentatricopeptide repeat-containing protein At2g03380, mitochondrial-like n=1 Tax=Pistacia vera TaxID=55513 RepID=UPI001262DA4F|nr:pentatricopeptide repeat-containing protein At2g03380, mitochondrial-like [Pistacia vera]
MMKLVSFLHRSGKPFPQLKFLSYSTPRLDPHQTVASIPLFSLLGICKNIFSLKRMHALLIVDGLADDVKCNTKLVSMYGSFGHVKYARLVFDRMRDPDLYSFKVMMRWYFLNDLYKEIVEFYNSMRKCVKEHDNVVFSIVLKACSELRDIDQGRKVHCEVVKAGSPDDFVLTGLVDMYAKCGEIDFSRQVFDETVDKNVVSWTSMIVGYVQNDRAREGLILFNQMREVFIEGNQFTLGSLVTACTKLGFLHQGKWIHGHVIKIGVELNSILVTALLDMYVKCGDIRDARSVFDGLSTIDFVSWTAMIVGYTQRGYPDEALKLFTDAKWVGVFPNCVTITSLLSACAQLGNLNLGKTLHGLGIKLGFEDPTVFNALIDMYAKCHMIEDARYIFETVSDKNVITWNSIISGYSQNGYSYEPLELLHRMRSDSITPDAVTLVVIFSACASLGTFQVGSSLHAFTIKEGLLSSNVYVGTALLNFYAKCGDAESARMVFDDMGEKNTVTWSAMIGGYGMQGDGSGSLALFSDMLKDEVQPNEVIFTTILSACSHTGMVGEGWQYFYSMCQDFNFVPSMKHYTCMVDLLARAGRLEEALDFIENMPVQPDVSLFGAFLHGCGMYSRFDLGEVVIRRMLQLHPDKACYYVLMSNLYASDGRWSQVNQVRELMRGLSKSPGCSRVDLDVADDFSCSRVASFA